MIVDGRYGPAIQEINTAEADLRNVGRIRDALIVTGVNQCRYVGQHLLRALVGTDEESIRSDLDAAKKHAQRAIYDINDSAIQFYIRQIDDLREKHFPTVDFASVVPAYGEVANALVEGKRLVEMTSDAVASRENYYQDARKAVASLRQAYEVLSVHKPDFVKAVRKENHNKMITWIGIGVAALSALVLVLFRVL